MTREQAESLCAQRAEEHPERGWLPRCGSDGEWTVVSLSLPRGRTVKPLKATTEAKPEPAQPDDPRPAYWRDVGGPWA
jgi:hypothetical protein